MKAFRINIVALKNSVHQFDFEIGRDFFEQYGNGLISEGDLGSSVTLDKHETFIEAKFKITGTVVLICNRSLERFDFPLSVNKKIVFKYGDENAELSDEIVMIHRESDSLEIGQYIYEFIALEIPMKKIHPKFKDEEDTDESGKIIYTSESNDEEGSSSDDIDPRWEKLKKLNKQ